MANQEPKRLLRKTVKQYTAVGTTDTLLFDKVPPDQEWWIDWVSVMNDDAVITSWYPFIRRNGVDYPIKQSADTTQDIRHGLQVQTWLGANEELGGVVEGRTPTPHRPPPLRPGLI